MLLCLRILSPWSIDPSKSAYEGFTGKPFDFSAHPIGPAACEVMAFVPKELRKISLYLLHFLLKLLLLVTMLFQLGTYVLV